LTLGLARKKSLSNNTPAEQDVLFNIGYEIAGPIQLFYLFWIIERSYALNISKLHFLSRDGYYLYQIFQLLKKKQEIQIEGNYTYASRRLYFIPGINNIDEDSLSLLTNAQQRLKLSDFFRRINLHVKPYEKILQNIGFKDIQQIITDSTGNFIQNANLEKLKSFFKIIGEDIIRQATTERMRLLSYYQQTGLMQPNAAIVDVGWNASSLKYLSELFRKEGYEVPKGFYFGTWENTKSLLDEGNYFESFFMHLSNPKQRRGIIKGNIAIIESFFSAPHPTVIGIEKVNDQWNPIFEEMTATKENEQSSYLFEGIMSYVNDIINMPGFKISSGYHYIQTVAEKILNKPSYEQAKILGKFRHKISFGSVSEMLAIAAEPSKKMTRKERKQYLENSFWKNGTKAMLNSRAYQKK